MGGQDRVTSVSDLVRVNVWTMRAENKRSAQRTGGDKSRWSQAGMANALGMSESTYRDLERSPRRGGGGGQHSRGSLLVDDVIALAWALNCDVATLLQPTKQNLKRDAAITVRPTHGSQRIRFKANRFRLWLYGLAHLPGQSASAFNRLLSRPWEEEESGDTRSVRPRVPAAPSGEEYVLSGGWSAAKAMMEASAAELRSMSAAELSMRATAGIRQLVRHAEQGDLPDDVALAVMDDVLAALQVLTEKVSS